MNRRRLKTNPRLFAATHAASGFEAKREKEDSGLRFDDTLPIVRIDVPNPELESAANGDPILIRAWRSNRPRTQSSSSNDE